jgi:hypothetical protein
MLGLQMIEEGLGNIHQTQVHCCSTIPASRVVAHPQQLLGVVLHLFHYNIRYNER